MYRRNDCSSIRTVQKTVHRLPRAVFDTLFLCLIFVTLTGEDEIFFGLDLNRKQYKNDGAYAIYLLVIIDPRPRREGRSPVIIIISPSIVNIFLYT